MKSGDNYNAHLIALADKAAEQLEGTCKAIYELGSEYEDDSNEQVFCNRFDELVFECQQCNWWFEQSKMAVRDDNEWICQECTDED